MNGQRGTSGERNEERGFREGFRERATASSPPALSSTSVWKRGSKERRAHRDLDAFALSEEPLRIDNQDGGECALRNLLPLNAWAGIFESEFRRAGLVTVK